MTDTGTRVLEQCDSTMTLARHMWAALAYHSVHVACLILFVEQGRPSLGTPLGGALPREGVNHKLVASQCLGPDNRYVHDNKGRTLGVWRSLRGHQQGSNGPCGSAYSILAYAPSWSNKLRGHCSLGFAAVGVQAGRNKPTNGAAWLQVLAMGDPEVLRRQQQQS